MKTESTVKPEKTAVEKCGDIADVILCENITEENREEGVFYTYDEYRISVPFRPSLLAAVEGNRAEWLKKAMAEEAKTPTPTIEEELSRLKAENAALREKNKELDGLINIMLGGVESE